MHSRVTAKNVGDVFETQCSFYTVSQKTSNFRGREEVPEYLFLTHLLGQTPTFRVTKFDIKKLETYRSIVLCENYFAIFNRLGVWLTSMTDEQVAFGNSAL